MEQDLQLFTATDGIALLHQRLEHTEPCDTNKDTSTMLLKAVHTFMLVI